MASRTFPRSWMRGKYGCESRSPGSVFVLMTTTIQVSDPSACGRLLRHAFTQNEFPSLLETIFSSREERDRISSLSRVDAQIFVDAIDGALDSRPGLPPRMWEKCLKLLYRTCGTHGLLPKSFIVPVRYDMSHEAIYRGGCADIWKVDYHGQDVAVKVIRTYSNSDLPKIVGRFCKEAVTWKFLHHPNVLPLMGVTISEVRLAMVSNWMTNGNINDFVESHPEVDRFSLLVGVTKGLIYIHDWGMVHGDLKGSNILIDQAGNPRIADFGLLTVISDPSNPLASASYTQGGTARWMSPELIDPDRFRLKDSRPTTSSDCYALGMVIYETISGHMPFHEHTDMTVFVNVMKGERPPREEMFTDDLWKTMKSCWLPNPKKRPKIEDVLQCLNRALNSSNYTKKRKPTFLLFKLRTRSLSSDASLPSLRSSSISPDRGSFHKVKERRLTNPSMESTPAHKDPQGVWNTTSDLPGRVTVNPSPSGSNGPATVPTTRKPWQDHRMTLPQDTFPSPVLLGLSPWVSKDIDEIDNRLENYDLPDRERQKLLNELCKKCSRNRVVPTSMHVPDCTKDSVEVAYGGSASVLQSTYKGRCVAVKIFRVHSDLNTILSGFCREAVTWKHLRHPNILPLLGVTVSKQRFAMVSAWMENGNINQFVERDQHANRPMLLVDVANGLKYLHGLPIVHGDLKGANILINRDKRACIADFGLATTTSIIPRAAARDSQTSLVSSESLMSFTSGGTYRWMSPELLDPEWFGTPQSEGSIRPTTQSDCYAFGMVIYEVLCGHHPYVHIQSDIFLVSAIMEGVRPEKPEGATRLGFTENLWSILERCWLEDRNKRPAVEDILPCLNDATLHWYMGTANNGDGPVSIPARSQTPSSIRVGSPLIHTEGNPGPRNTSRSPPRRYAPTSSGIPPTCRLDGCDDPVFVDKVNNDPSEYCSQRHQKDAVMFGQVHPCIMCQIMPRCRNDHFCSRVCREKALSA